MALFSYLDQFNIVSILVRLILATLFGGMIGLERGFHGKSAGIRTFSLVCLGSAVVMVTAEYLLKFYEGSDVARMGAQVISGVGFLGVGTIIVTGKNFVKGLTTAAGLWATACLGITLGAGYIPGAVITLILMFFIMTVLSSISRKTDAYVSVIRLYMEIGKENGVDTLYGYASENNFRVTSVNRQQKLPLKEEDIPVIFEMDLGKRRNHAEIIEALRGFEDVHYIEEVH